MTITYKNVFLKETATVVGPYEKKGPLKKYFDLTYDNLYIEEKTWEKAEVKHLTDSIDILLNKINKNKQDISLFIAGDLLNQIAPSSKVAATLGLPFLGIYSACATSVEGIIIGANMIEAKQINDVICSTSSHNLAAERQFRYPTEYGYPKPQTATFTATGGASVYLTNSKAAIKIDSATIGKVIDLAQTDVYNMGAVMAGAAADTIYCHLKDTKRKPDYYDLILTGDLGLYGKKVLQDYMEKHYNLNLKDNYNDCGIMLYDLEKQKEVNAGGSGSVCCPLVVYSLIKDKLLNKELKKVLIVATGALFSPTFFLQKETLPAVAHAVSLEMIE